MRQKYNSVKFQSNSCIWWFDWLNHLMWPSAKENFILFSLCESLKTYECHSLHV